LEVDVQQGNFQIPRIFLQILILFLVEKWNPPTRSETAKIGKKIEGILGVNGLLPCPLEENLFKVLQTNGCNVKRPKFHGV
jgi:hypothetical protein